MYTVSFQLRFMSWLISSQEEGKIFLHQMVGDWKEETQEFCGAPVRFGLRTPKCILRHVSDSSSFRYQASTDWKHANLKTQKSKSENYWLQLVPLPAILRRPPLSPTATQPWSSPYSVWRPLVVTTLTIGAWWNSDLLFIIKSAWVDVILTASFICLSRQLWKLPTTSIENSCFSPLYPSLQSFCQNLSNNGKSFSLFSSANWYPQYLVEIWQWGAPNANDISLQIFVPVHSNSKC